MSDADRAAAPTSEPALLALDFDGVIADSAPESFAVALSTYRRLRPGSFAAPDPAPAALAGAPESGDPLYREFLRRMPLGNRAEDYAVVLASLERGLGLADQAAYDAFKASLGCAWLDAFHEAFYRQRRDFADRDRAAWLAAMPPYDGLPQILRRAARRRRLAIATAKDGETVAALLRHYGIDDLFAPELVVDKQAGRSKREHLRLLCARSGIDPRGILFVDDKLNHLEEVAGLGVRCALAGWGYNGERERQRAIALGIPVLEPAALAG